jgi:hypothetical protein
MNTIKRNSGQETQGAGKRSAQHPLDWQTGARIPLRILCLKSLSLRSFQASERAKLLQAERRLVMNDAVNR